MEKPKYQDIKDIETHKMPENNRLYEITIAPPPMEAKLPTPLSDNQFKEFYRYYRCKYLKPLDSYAEYKMVPEISKKGLLHWHGTITFRDSARYFCLERYAHQAQIAINPFRKEWMTYIMKDADTMKPYITKLGLQYITSETTPKTKEDREDYHVTKLKSKYGFNKN